jgi:hypothetical protein
VGADFSAPLIEIARKYNGGGGGVRYEVMSALAPDDDVLRDEAPFSRILMYAALQHFGHSDLATIIEAFLRYATRDAVILLGGVLDADRKSTYLDTPEKLAMYEAYLREGRDRLGTWWVPADVVETCRRLGLRCDIDDRTPGRAGAHYRFDARISRQA